MKIILSRKGFDSKFGGFPSPILPDGTMISFPIPSSDNRTFSEVRATDNKSLLDLMVELGRHERLNRTTCHLDPDLDPNAMPRTPGWRPSLGQLGAAQTHLSQQGINIGDLFLFFGWFRKTEIRNGHLRYLKGSENHFHAIFGYLQIGQVLQVNSSPNFPKWLEGHPHTSPSRSMKSRNTIYVAADHLSLNPILAGGGKLKFTEKNRLTKPGLTRSRWSLDPRVFQDAKISYHNENSWKDGYFQSAAIGQEFVIRPNELVLDWAGALIRSGSPK